MAAKFGPVDGLEVVEILAMYEEAEWRTDWAWVLDTYGADDANITLMPRSADQRRADAVTAALRDAASKPPGAKPPKPTVNVHIDWHSFQDIAVQAELLPERDVVPFDHRHEYSRGGLTDPDNAGPGCKRHNLLRCTITRDRFGNWHTYRPDGTEIQ